MPVISDIFLIQIGRGKKGSYKTRWKFNNIVQAHLYYRSLNIGNGYKKRLVLNGKVKIREFS